MKNTHRKVHRMVWLILLPTLLLSVALLSQTTRDATPAQPSVPGYSQQPDGKLMHRVLP